MSTVQTTIRGISSTPAINYQINRYFKKIKKTCNKINKCRIVIDLTRNNTHKDKLYSVCIDITLPGKELVSKKQDPNLFIAMRNSFLALEQLLEKHHKRKLTFSKNYTDFLPEYGSMAQAG